MILYLETSDLVKLYAEEPDSDEVSGRVQAADIVATSILSYAEARAAFSRKFREEGIDENEYERVKKELHVLLLPLKQVRTLVLHWNHISGQQPSNLL